MADLAALNDGNCLVHAACDQMLYGSYTAGACGAFSATVTIAPELCKRQGGLFVGRPGERHSHPPADRPHRHDLSLPIISRQSEGTDQPAGTQRRPVAPPFPAGA
jgi:hypothetical protein